MPPGSVLVLILPHILIGFWNQLDPWIDCIELLGSCLSRVPVSQSGRSILSCNPMTWIHHPTVLSDDTLIRIEWRDSLTKFQGRILFLYIGSASISGPDWGQQMPTLFVKLVWSYSGLLVPYRIPSICSCRGLQSVDLWVHRGSCHGSWSHGCYVITSSFKTWYSFKSFAPDSRVCRFLVLQFKAAWKLICR